MLTCPLFPLTKAGHAFGRSSGDGEVTGDSRALASPAAATRKIVANKISLDRGLFQLLTPWQDFVSGNQANSVWAIKEIQAATRPEWRYIIVSLNEHHYGHYRDSASYFSAMKGGTKERLGEPLLSY